MPRVFSTVGEGTDFRLEPLDVEGVRIEIVAQSFAGFGVAFAVGIGERFKYFSVAPGAAGVLGRTPADWRRVALIVARMTGKRVEVRRRASLG